MPEFSFLARIVVNCEPGKEFINCIFLPQTKIRMQILSTEPIMYRGHGVVHSKFLMGGSVPPIGGDLKGEQVSDGGGLAWDSRQSQCGIKEE